MLSLKHKAATLVALYLKKGQDAIATDLVMEAHSVAGARLVTPIDAVVADASSATTLTLKSLDVENIEDGWMIPGYRS